MIHVFVSDLQPNLVGNQQVEIIVSNGIAEVDFPQMSLRHSACANGERTCLHRQCCDRSFDVADHGWFR